MTNIKFRFKSSSVIKIMKIQIIQVPSQVFIKGFRLPVLLHSQ